MPKPITPMVACDTFVVNDRGQLLMIKRKDNSYWALPGGCHDLGETPAECAARECWEETGYQVKVTRLLGVYSSNRYAYVNYPYKENEFTHILFAGEVVGGSPTPSEETLEVGWFGENEIPPLSDGHEPRIRHGFASLRDPSRAPHFE